MSTSPRRRRWVLPLAAVAAVLAAGVVGGVITSEAGIGDSSSPPRAPTPASASSSNNPLVCNVATVANRALQSVVTISAQGSASGGGSTGSGEVIRTNGYVLTNNHVISVAAQGGQVQVIFTDGKAFPASIVGRDPLTDLAVLKINASQNFTPIDIGSSASVFVGEPVVAVGSPLGLTGTVTSGIVSALDRTVEVPGENNTSALLVSAVQTDAAINPGNSGGALLNCNDRLIGIPSAGAQVPSSSGESSGGNIGLGFAIPVDLATSIADEIISTGHVTHAWFGMETVPIPPAAASQAGVPEGLRVNAVASGGPAARAGLRTGDVITRIAGDAAVSNRQLDVISLTRRPGDRVDLTYARSGRSTTVTLTLGSLP
ncbi:MAG: trypsin-like peptidase domain-containing protein [Acidimicrobiaceae bacterium]|nr:trypsin-like peptidase domain-containing protein [Acidimicrobiaceae bacterium]